MSKKGDLIVTGCDLNIPQIFRFLFEPNTVIKLHPEGLKAVVRSRAFLVNESRHKIVYGVNTGLGPMASYLISAEKNLQLQKNLIYSHAVGMGDPIENDFVLASMIIRLNTLVRGFSGVSPALLDRLLYFINHRILPVIPEHGAVGTSGDLVQLAHIALALTGKGEVWYLGKREAAKKVLAKLRLKPYNFKPKEGLALINGTSVMTGIVAVISGRIEHLLNLAILQSALAMELTQAFSDALAEGLHLVRPHRGQVMVAKALREILVNSKLLQDRETFQTSIRPQERGVAKISERVQDVYSFRCVPQILGPIVDSYLTTRQTVETEMNSVTDNPVVDSTKRKIYHGGNFHGDYIASAVDQVKFGLVKFTLLLERRINFFLNQNVNQFLPPFLNLKTPGLTFGLQGLQFVATSTAAQSQSLAYPHSVHSISTNGDNQDVVSMGTDAALIASKVVDNAYLVSTIELVTLLQAADVLKVVKKLSPPTRELYEKARKVFSLVESDRVLIDDLTRLREFILTTNSVSNWLRF